MLEFVQALSSGLARATAMGVRTAKAEAAKAYHDARVAHNVRLFRRRAALVADVAGRLAHEPTTWMTPEEREVHRVVAPVTTRLIMKEIGGDAAELAPHMDVIREAVNTMATTAAGSVVAQRRNRRQRAARALRRA